jgi:GNAT superfamily N-acetyltransferase
VNHNTERVLLADAIEAAANRDMFAAAPAELAVHTEEIAGATLLIAPQIPVPQFNRVIGLGDVRPATESTLDAVCAAYRAAGVPNFWLHQTPTAQPLQLADWLRSRGFALADRRSWAKFLRGTAPPSPREQTHLKIRAATSADVEDFARIACAAFGMPDILRPWLAALAMRAGWQCYLAFDGPRPIAVGAMYIRQRVAWLGIGATLPEFRGRGAQSALLAQRIRAAIAAGCTTIATETGDPTGDEPNPSLRNIMRVGFVKVCSRLNYSST